MHACVGLLAIDDPPLPGTWPRLSPAPCKTQAPTHAWAGQVAQEHLPQTPRSILDPGGSPELAPAQPDTHAVQSQATLSDRAGLSDAPDCGRAHAAADNGPRSTAEVLQDRQEQGGPHQLLELVVGDQRRALARFAPPLPGATSPLRYPGLQVALLHSTCMACAWQVHGLAWIGTW